MSTLLLFSIRKSKCLMKGGISSPQSNERNELRSHHHGNVTLAGHKQDPSLSFLSHVAAAALVNEGSWDFLPCGFTGQVRV